MVRTVGIRFKTASKIYSFDSRDFNIRLGDGVLVETVRGKELGFCASPTTEIDEEKIENVLKPVLRIATEEDLNRYRENIIKASEALRQCNELVEKHNLPMKLLDANYTFDNHKLLFYFTSEGRVDFRELVKDLASIYRTRIELRQIGVRDGAKLLGGLGPCGQELCCCRFLKDFENVTIKMAKDQGLSLTPSKISGMCGRLMCCLSYEQDFYDERLKELPALKSLVKTPEGEGKVVDLYPITDEAKVLIEKEGVNQLFTFKRQELSYSVHRCNCPVKNKKKPDYQLQVETYDATVEELPEELKTDEEV